MSTGIPTDALVNKEGIVAPSWKIFFSLLASQTGSGTVTSVAASGGTTGFGFSGTPITTSGTLTLTVSNAATIRTAIGLGTLATQSGTFSGTSSGTNTGDQTNISGNAATVTTNANLTGPITSSGNATAIASQTGTGSKFVVDNTPTLITPNLGVASATSINFGGTTLSNYEEGTWTPVDNSGASLTFANVTGIYTRIGNIVICSARFDYPVTADASNSSVSGLPFTVKNSDAAFQGQIALTTGATAKDVLATSNTSVFVFYTAAGTVVTNAQMSASANRIQIIYHI